MGISETLGEIYGKVEDKFYGLLDALEQKGLPVYAVVNPIEDRGIPAFPLTIALLILFGALIYGFVFIGTSTEITFSLAVKDGKGSPLSNVQLSAEINGKKLDLPKSLYSNADTFTVSNVPLGSDIVFRGNKEGYNEAEYELKATGKTAAVLLVLDRQVEYIAGSFKLVDGETGSPIRDAVITASFEGASVPCSVDETGTVFCGGIPRGENILLSVKAPNYEDYDETTSFYANSVSEVALAPKATAMTGQSSFIIRVLDLATALPLDGVRIQVFDVEKDDALVDIISQDGEYLAEIDKGTDVRVVASKDGYVKFDSQAAKLQKTMRNDEELMEIKLRQGGVDITVSVSDAQTQIPLSDAEVVLYNSLGEELDRNKTAFGGYVNFDDLNVERDYYVTASAGNYLPKREKIQPIVQAFFNVQLSKQSSENSARITVYAADSSAGKAMNDVLLNFYELGKGGEKLPTGIAQGRTGMEGRYVVTMEYDRNMLIEGSKGLSKGSEVLFVERGGETDVVIYMVRESGLILLSLVGPDGLPVLEGNVRIETAAGEILYEGDTGQGEIIFDSGGNKTVKFIYTTDDGKVFTQELDVRAQQEIVVVIPVGELSSLSPQIEFTGVFDLSGNEVEGVVRGEDHYLRFTTTWPEGNYECGMHFRVGDDDVKFADSEDAGIIGFSAVGAEHFYGRTYNAEPKPGLEGIDFRNRGKAGNYNKWLELYYDDCAGTKVVDVRVEAKETAKSESFSFKYRGWAVLGGEYYRVPIDEVLGVAESTSDRSALYAGAESMEIGIFAARPSCTDELCTAYMFIKEDGTEYLPKDFTGAKEGKYALEIEFMPRLTTTATVKASTSKTNPKLLFNGYGVNQEGEFPTGEKSETSMEAEVSLQGNKKTKVRIYFTAKELGNAYITLQSISPQAAITESFNFLIVTEKALVVSTVPKNVSAGENFSVVVKDEDGLEIADATIRFRSSVTGELLRTIIGTGETGKGHRGVYDVENTLDPGVVVLEVSAPLKKPYSEELEIGARGVLLLPERLSIDIAEGDEEKSKILEVQNTSEETVTDLAFEVVKDGLAPGMDLEITAIPGIEPKAKKFVELKARYVGEEERAHGEAKVIVRGRVLGGYPVSAETTVVIEYNRALGEGCLVFSKEDLVVYLPDDEGSTASVELTLENRCDAELELAAEVVARGHNDGQIEINAPGVTLMDAGSEEASKTTRIDIANKILRNYPGKKSFMFDIIYSSAQLTKTLSAEVIIWNAKFALQVNRNLEVWITGAGQENRVVVPIFAKNIGEVDIENLRFDVSPDYGSAQQYPSPLPEAYPQEIYSAYTTGNTSLKILPPEAVPSLKKGQSLIPPRFIEVTALRDSKTTLLDRSQISVKGNIDGKSYDLGPINVLAHISPPTCVQVYGELSFVSAVSKSGAVTKSVTVRNNCAEAVRIRSVEPNTFGASMLEMAPLDFLLPGQEAELNLTLRRRGDYEGDTMVHLKAFLVNSGRWVDSTRFPVRVELGTAGAEAKDVSDIVEMKVCETGKAREVAMPRISVGAGCDKAYCDAQQLAEFLTEKLKEKLNDAERQVSHYQGDTLNSGCGQQGATEGYCDFSRLGIREDTFTVYMMNDSMSTEMLKDVIDKKGGNLGKFRVEHAASRQDFEGRLGGATGNRVFIAGNFRGCGMYTVSISGAVRVTGATMRGDMVDLLVDLSPEEGESGTLSRTITEHCENKIQNAMNFLPYDKGYSPSNKKLSWLAVVESSESEFDELGKAFAKQLFGEEERFGSSSSSNKLRLEDGETEGYLVKLSMKRAGGDVPRTITATVQPPFEQDKLAEGVVKEAAAAVGALQGKNLSDICISANEDYMLLGSPAEGDKAIEIEVCEGASIPVLSGLPSCCDVNIVSDNKGENFKADVGFVTSVSGVGTPWLQERGTAPDSGNAIAKGTEIEPGTDAVRKKAAISELMACVEGDEKDLHLALDKEIRINAESAQHSKRRAEEKRVKVAVCALHPIKFIEMLNEKNEAGNYIIPTPSQEGQETKKCAVVGWSGAPDEMGKGDLGHVLDVQKQLALLKGEEGAEEKTEARTVCEIKQSNTRKKGLLLAYLPSCVLTSIGMGLLKMHFAASVLIDPLIDCGIPGMVAFGNEFPAVQGVYDSIKGIASDTFGWVKKFAPANYAIEKGKAALDFVSSKLMGNVDEESAEVLGAAAVTTVGTHGLAYGITETMPTGTMASQISSKVTDKMMSNNFKGSLVANVPVVNRLTFKGKFEAAMKNSLSTKLNAHVKAGEKITDEAIEKLTTDAIAEAAADPGVKSALASASGKIKGSAYDDALKTITSDELLKDLDFEAAAKRIPLIGEHKISLSELAADPGELDTLRNSISSSLNTELIGELESKAPRELLEEVFERETLRDVAGTAINTRVDEMVSELTIAQPVYGTDNTLQHFTVNFDEKAAAAVGRAARTDISESLAAGAAGLAGDDAAERVIKDFAESAYSDASAAAGKKSLYSRFRNMASLTNAGKLLGNILKGVFKGVAANAVGMLAYNAYVDHYAEPCSAEEKAEISLGEGLDTGVPAFKKYRPYMARIVNRDGVRDYVWEELTSIPEDCERLDTAYCKGEAFEKGIISLPGIVPQAKQLQEKTETARDYKVFGKAREFENASRYIEYYGASMKAAAQTHNIPEELLVVVSAWKSNMGANEDKGNWLTGCNYGKPETAGKLESINCAAKELGDIWNKSCAEETSRVACTLEKYNETHKPGNYNEEERYYTKKLFTIWESFPKTYNAA